MIGIPVYIVLPEKTDELHTEPLRTEQNISRRMEVSSLPENPLCVHQRSSPYRYQSVPEGTRTECSRRNQNRVFPKEPEFGRWPATPYSPILFRQYKYTTCSCAYIFRILLRTYSQNFQKII